MTHPSVIAYWDRGARNVLDMTGARQLMDGSDLVGICHDFGIALPLQLVLDVGCGTGRLAQHCVDYLGVDISPSAIEYCQKLGLDVELIDGPETLPDYLFSWVLCISVFTHIDRAERKRYLDAFQAPSLIVDIIPGDGAGNVALWTAQPEEFEADLKDAGFSICGWRERIWPDAGWAEQHAPHANVHRYYHAERRA